MSCACEPQKSWISLETVQRFRYYKKTKYTCFLVGKCSLAICRGDVEGNFHGILLYIRVDLEGGRTVEILVLQMRNI